MRVRMSELAVCSVIAIEKECGREAADFYSYMQTAIIGEEFPIQCKYDFSAGELREVLHSKEHESIEIKSTTESSHFTVQELVLPSAPISKSTELNTVEDIPILFNKNGRFIPNAELAKKTLNFFQTERRKAASKRDDDEDDDEPEDLSKTKIVRTRTYSKLFKPTKFAEVNLSNKKQPENTVIIKLMSSEDSKEKNKTHSASKEESSGFLTGARPIPDGSISRSIISPKSEIENREQTSEENSVIDKYEESLKDSVPALSAARESYTPKIEFIPSTTTELLTTTSAPETTTTKTTTTATTRTTSASTTTTPTQVTLSYQWPSTMMIMLPSSTAKPAVPSTVKPAVPSTVDKFLPWYYNTFTTKSNDPLVTANPMFPYFNPESLSTNGDIVDPYYTQGHQNLDPNKFAVNFVSNMNPPSSTPIKPSSSSQKLSNELSTLLDYSTFKEKADAFLTTAIDVLKPREKTHPTFSDHGFYRNPLPTHNHISHHPGNRTASGALSELMDTIERISPAVIDNIREKLDSLGQK